MIPRIICTGICSLIGTWIGWYFHSPLLGAGIGLVVGLGLSVLFSPWGPDCLDASLDACIITDCCDAVTCDCSGCECSDCGDCGSCDADCS